jgi:hypothetical protein
MVLTKSIAAMKIMYTRIGHYTRTGHYNTRDGITINVIPLFTQKGNRMNTKERQAKIEVIRAFPALLEAYLDTIPEAKLDVPCGASGEWTARQVVHHLADAHMNGFIRMKLVVSEERPILKPYDQDAWASHGDVSLPVESSLDILRGLHARWAAFLESLPDESWSRSGIHLENGLVSLEVLLNIYAAHGARHIEQIQKA